MSKKKIIIVNATALSSGGGLVILNQFLNHIPNVGLFYIFINPKISLTINQNNVYLVKINTNSWFKRVFWDIMGLRIWLWYKNIQPEVALSLQNTSFNTPNKTKLFIYIHQSLFLHEKKWSLFKKQEFNLALYSQIYPFFIFLFKKSLKRYWVQTFWMKKKLCKKYQINESLIKVAKPILPKIDINKIITLPLVGKIILFYPASPLIYKNHYVIVQALHYLKKSGYSLESIKVFFTFYAEDNLSLKNEIKKLDLESSFVFTGPLLYEEVLSYYISCTAVIFPSYVESFGLPLLEAASFSKPILCSDCDYAKEVIGDYSGVNFIKYNNPELWAHKIRELIDNTHEISPYYQTNNNTWCDLISELLSN